MFKRFRIAILLYILLFVALGEFLASRRATDWDNTLWVDIYTMNGSGSEATQSYIDALEPDAFAGIETFFEQQAKHYGQRLDQPFKVRVVGQLDDGLPRVPDGGSTLSAITWSLKMRWFVSRLHWTSNGPTPDITVFAVYHDAADGIALDRSTALRKGMIAVANLYASRRAAGSNRMVVAHEILHTLGASDKYDLATGAPNFPNGFADAARDPLYPQSRAELMAGRIPLDPHDFKTPSSLNEVLVGSLTAMEIGWIEDMPDR